MVTDECRNPEARHVVNAVVFEPEIDVALALIVLFADQCFDGASSVRRKDEPLSTATKLLFDGQSAAICILFRPWNRIGINGHDH